MLSNIAFIADFLAQDSVAEPGIIGYLTELISQFLGWLGGLLGAFFDWVGSYVDIIRLPLIDWLKERENFWTKTALIFLQPKLWSDLGSTAIMVAVSGGVAIAVGTPLGVLQVVTEKKGLKSNIFVNKVLGAAINIGRSIPFIIFCFILIPVSRMLMGGSIGVKGAIVPLSISAIPFMARLAETALKEVPQGLIEAAQSMGATPMQIIRKVMLREALPGLISGITIMLISLIGYSAMAGYVGAGGLGDYAINHGYQRNRWEIVLAAVTVIVAMVQITQLVGDKIANKVNHR